MTVVTDELMAGAEVHYGDEVGQQMAKLLLKDVGFPMGLLALKDITECGYVKETGFVWMRQKRTVYHYFKKVGKTVCFSKEIAAFAEKCRLKKLTGVQAKELKMWFTVSEIFVDDPPSGKLTCKTPFGLSQVYPTSAFEEEEEVSQ